MKNLVVVAVLLLMATACDTGQSATLPNSSPPLAPSPIPNATDTTTTVKLTSPASQAITVPQQAPRLAESSMSVPATSSQASVPTTTTATGTWRGLVILDEKRCSLYDADDYSYSQSVEPRIVADMGGIIYGPYTGNTYSSTRETDIEHIVARSEAHDSGLCAASDATRKRFSSDLLNLTLASPSVNRHQKSGKDAAEWLPDLNRCWFAARILQVKREYGLTVDPREADALDAVLSGCASFELVVVSAPPQAQPTSPPAQRTGSPSNTDPLSMYDDNGNGRITCAEARSHGIAPVRRDHPAYQYMRDGDGDGIVCE